MATQQKNMATQQKNKGGRPKGTGKYSMETRAKLLESLQEYVKETSIPIFKEWCVRNSVLPQTVHQWEEFSDAIKYCTTKKEADLERLALLQVVDKTMAIFSLKQLGWRDRQEVDFKGMLYFTDEEVDKMLLEEEREDGQ